MKEQPVRILVPLDGSSEAERILPAILPLVRSIPSEVTVFRAIPAGQPSAEALAYLSGVRGSLATEGVVARWRAEEGQPPDEILGLAAGGSFDLIAMATHGRSGLRRVLMGSVAEEVLRHTTLPIIVSRPEAKVGDWKRIVVSLDGSEPAEEIVGTAVRLGRLLKATIHTIAVRASEAPPEGGDWGGGTVAAGYLRDLCDRIAGEGVLATWDAPVGRPSEVIPAHAARLGAGLICMTTHGRTGLSRVLLGSTAEEILRVAPCPVLVRRIDAGGRHTRSEPELRGRTT